MRTFYLRLVFVGGALLALPAPSAQAGLWPFGKKTQKPAPEAGELQGQEAAAAELLRQAEGGKGISGYKQIVSKYPLTSSAATAQFRIAQAYESDGKLLKAFDEFQVLIDTYKSSPHFAQALDSQFNIAKQARSERLDSLMGIKKKLGREDTLKLFKQVVDNAPQGAHAAESTYEMAQIYEEDGSTGAAINSYQDVVDQYSRSPLAAEAQKKIAELNFDKVESGTRDASALKESRDAAAQAASLFPDASATAETRELMPQIDEKEAENAFRIGRFYEKSGNKKAAIIYYNDVLRYPAGAKFEEARDRVNALTTTDPSLLEQSNVKISNKQLAVRAEADVKGRPDYLGPPPPPDLDRHLRKPKMRSGTTESIPIAPIEEPALPGEKPAGRPDDTLLKPSTPELVLPPTPEAEMPPKEGAPAEEAPKAAPAPEAPTPEAPAKPAEEKKD